MAQRANGLARAKRTRKHRVALCPKHGRGAIHDQCREGLGQIPGRPCQWRGVEAIEGHLMPGHARMPAGVPPETVEVVRSTTPGAPEGTMPRRWAAWVRLEGEEAFWTWSARVATWSLATPSWTWAACIR